MIRIFLFFYILGFIFLNFHLEFNVFLPKCRQVCMEKEYQDFFVVHQKNTTEQRSFWQNFSGMYDPFGCECVNYSQQNPISENKNNDGFEPFQRETFQVDFWDESNQFQALMAQYAYVFNFIFPISFVFFFGIAFVAFIHFFVVQINAWKELTINFPPGHQVFEFVDANKTLSDTQLQTLILQNYNVQVKLETVRILKILSHKMLKRNG